MRWPRRGNDAAHPGFGTPASYSFAARDGRTLADNAPEAILSLASGTAVPSGLKPSVAEKLRADTFPYVVPA